MKIALIALVALASIGATPANAVAPTADVVVTESITASAGATLSNPEPVVTTTAAPVAPVVFVAIPEPVAAPVTLAAPVVVSVPTVEPLAPVAAPVVPEQEQVLTEDGTNPECAEQSMQTGADGSCIITECPEAGQTMDSDGNCATTKNDYGQELTPEPEAGTVVVSEQSGTEQEQENEISNPTPDSGLCGAGNAGR